METIYRLGVKYKKSGVIFSDISPDLAVFIRFSLIASPTVHNALNCHAALIYSIRNTGSRPSGLPWKKIKNTFPNGKKFRSYPSVKIGRFAVVKEYQSQHIGAQLMSVIKVLLSDDNIYWRSVSLLLMHTAALLISIDTMASKS